ncbi:MAG: hypothetical protein LBR27_08630 [Bifidobacteriaceae bacterium]|jgi:hypothetical protein|nr:hypothetical protein [Bifidobacteriaceae bacterium]
MSEQPVVALVTCSQFPTLEAYDAVLIPRLKSMGIAAVPAVWDDPVVDWDLFDLSIVRSTWDYAGRRDEFLAWARSVPRLANPASVLEWNTDKHYLKDLAALGVPIVPTIWLEPEANLGARGLHTRFPALGDFVLKPAVSAGAIGAGRYTANDVYLRGRAIQHALHLMAEGRSVMLQRYLPSVDTKGETSMVFLDGQFAYAVRKDAMLHGPEQAEGDRMYQAETLLGGYTPSPEEMRVGELAVGGAMEAMGNPIRPFLYARADVVVGNDGQPVLLELELTEPSLFPELAPGGIDKVCRAIAGRLSPV